MQEQTSGKFFSLNFIYILEFLKWVVKELGIFCDHIKFQVFSVIGNDFKTIATAIGIICNYAKKVTKKKSFNKKS